ncbi:MAG: restriction endonuclease subunit S [Lautropia sp.]|nr:restriction endonuclease subunit S [Lautropia sp.]
MASDWQRVTIGEAFEVNPSRPLSRGTVAPFIPMDALPVNARQPERIDTREVSGSGMRFKNGDTLLARITPCLENGKTVFINQLSDEAIGHGSTEYIVISGRNGVSDDLFGYYLARSPDFRSYAISHMEGTSGRQRVPASAVCAYQLNLPPFQEQRAIAHILGTLDEKIELNRKQNETLEAMARALFKAWFVDFEPVRAKMEGRWQRGQSLPGLPAHLYDLFPERLVESGLGGIPEGWRYSTIGEEVMICGGSTPSTKEPEFWEGGQHCWATPKDLSALKFPVMLDTDRKITDAGLAKISSGLLPVGTVLLSSRAPIGYLAIAEVPTAINQGFIAMRCHGALPNVFVLPWCRESMDAIVGNANGSTFQEISKSNFRPLRVVIPSESVLKYFTRSAVSLYRQLADNERESRSLAQLRDTLLPKLISGDLRVPDAERILGEAENV